MTPYILGVWGGIRKEPARVEERRNCKSRKKAQNALERDLSCGAMTSKEMDGHFVKISKKLMNLYVENLRNNSFVELPPR